MQPALILVAHPEGVPHPRHRLFVELEAAEHDSEPLRQDVLAMRAFGHPSFAVACPSELV